MDPKHFFVDEDEYDIGNRLEDFDFLQYLGGSHLEIFAKVKSKNNHEIYVMKIIKNIKEDKYIDIENKINMAKLLDHPNIMKYYSSFVENNNYHLLMEYAENGNINNSYKIHKFLKKEIPRSKIINIQYQSMSGLKYLHDKGFLHRNINPSSIFITKDDKIKIGGFEHLIKSRNIKKRTINNLYSLYSSDNMINGKDYGRESDIYSLECVFYQLNTLEMKNIVIKNSNIYNILPISNHHKYKFTYPKDGNRNTFEAYISQNQQNILNLYTQSQNQNTNIKCAYLSIVDILKRYIINIIETRNIISNNLHKPITNSIFNFNIPIREINDLYLYNLKDILIKNEKSFSKLGEIPIFELIKYLIKQLHIENNEYNNNYSKIISAKSSNIRTKKEEFYLLFKYSYRKHFKSFISSEIGFYGKYEIKRICDVCREASYYFESFYYIILDLDNIDNIEDAFNKKETIKTYRFCFNCQKMTMKDETKSIIKYPVHLVIFIKNEKNKRLNLQNYLNIALQDKNIKIIYKLVSTIYKEENNKNYEFNYLDELAQEKWLNQRGEISSYNQGRKAVVFYIKKSQS